MIFIKTQWVLMQVLPTFLDAKDNIAKQFLPFTQFLSRDFSLGSTDDPFVGRVSPFCTMRSLTLASLFALSAVVHSCTALKGSPGTLFAGLTNV